MDDKSLVQNEGVDAASDQALHEPDQPASRQATDSVRAGGHPEDAPTSQPESESKPDDAELVGAADGRPESPEQSTGSAGQDAGSID